VNNPFKAYDIRGIYPQEINEQFALQLGKAIGTYIKGKKIVVARDGRQSGDKLYPALIKGILTTGTNVVTIGKVSTPQFYYALYSGTADGGVMITASHNPKAYNGFKICRANAEPVFKENGLQKIEKIMRKQHYSEEKKQGEIIERIINQDYVKSMKKLAKTLTKKFTILADTGNGMGILEVKALKKIYGEKLTVKVMFPEIDGNFPNHECNPTVKENLEKIVKEIKKRRVSFGIAFDGDADRVVFITSDGLIIPSDIITGIIGSEFVKKGEKAGYEVRSSRTVNELFEKKGIIGQLYPSGHAYIKERMKKDRARFAGEKSGHYFYQNLHYTDSSLYTIINMLEILDRKKISLKKIAQPIVEKYANSGELNYEVNDTDVAIRVVKNEFSSLAEKMLEIDGVSIYTKNYFFNIRKSNTEPLVRVNIEGNNKDIVKELQERIERLISRA